MSTENQKVSKKKMRKQQIQSAFLATVTLITLVAFGSAWFVNNSRVSAEGVMISAEGNKFELASIGKQGIYDKDVTVKGTTTKQFEGSTSIYYLTSGSQTSISWMLNENSNLSNMDKNKGVHPDSAGSISFSVIPQKKDLSSADLLIEVIPYENGSASDQNAVKIDGQYYVPLDKDSEEYKLLMGHLLLFEGYSVQDRYSNRLNANIGITTDDLTKQESSTPEHWDYTIYWIWPGLFRQYIDRGDANSIFGREEVYDTEYEELLADINEKTEHYFAGYESSTPTVESGISSSLLSEYSDFYNNGDEIIGISVQYVQVRITIS